MAKAAFEIREHKLYMQALIFRKTKAVLLLVIGILVAWNRETWVQGSRIPATVQTANKITHHPRELPA